MDAEKDRTLGPSASAPDLETDWTFAASRPPGWMVRARLRVAVRRSIPFPRSQVLKSNTAPGPWALYFVYAPDGVLEKNHVFCLDALRSQGFSIVVVVAGMEPAVARETLGPNVACLIWKDLPGFDFSAYALGLWWLARHAPGCDVLVLNDSVYGPFGDVAAMLKRAPWRLTAFTGSGCRENHTQSYAFMIRALDARLLSRLSLVLNTVRAFNRFDDVVLMQELRLARVASRAASVGALWYSRGRDPTLAYPRELLAAGFPFIKRSLLGKHILQQPEGVIRAELQARGFRIA